MGIPIKKIVEVGLGVAGVGLGGSKLENLEKEENKLLAAILGQQQLTNAILLRMLEDNIGQEAVEEFVEEQLS